MKAPRKVIDLRFSAPQLEVIQSTAPITLMHCGVGSGKTYVLGAKTGIYAHRYPHVRGFIGANTYNQLSKSTLVGVFKFWEEKLHLRREVDYVVNCQPPDHFKTVGPRLENYSHTISFSNGKLYFLASMDNYVMIEGQEFAHADLDETKETKEDAVKEVIIARLRQPGLYMDATGKIFTQPAEGRPGYTPLNVYTSPAKTEWISEWFELAKFYDEITATIFTPGNYFRKRTGNKLIVIASTHHNSENVAPGYIDNIIDANRHNPHRVNMLVYGSPIGKVGNEYYNCFDRFLHVRERECPENIAIHYSFDFNRVPYITLGCYKTWFNREYNIWEVHKFDEICLPPPKNTTEHLCEEAIRKHAHILTNGLFIYGDSSGKNRRTNSNEHDFDVIFRKLRKYTGTRDNSDRSLSDRVITNMPVKTRKEFMNRVFYNSTLDPATLSVPIRFTMSPKCINTTKDCEFLQEAPDGGKIKEKNKEGHEKYGHCSDELEYFHTSAFNKYINI